MRHDLRFFAACLVIAFIVIAGGPARGASLRVVVAPPHAPLLPVLRERFARRNWTASIEQRDSVNRAELTTQVVPDAAVVNVFIDLQTVGWARLVFVQPGGERFTIRDLPFAQGLNEVARETIGIVVDSAVDSLFAGLQFELSRNDAEVALQQAPTPRPQDAASQVAVAPQPAKQVPRPPVDSAAAVVRETASAPLAVPSWTRYLGVGYSASSGGTSGLPWLAGPSLLLGQHKARTLLQLEGTWLLSTQIKGDVLAGDVWGVASRGSAGWRWSRGAVSWALVPVRVGVEVLRVNPQAESTRGTPASAQTVVSPMVGAAAGALWRLRGGITMMGFVAADVDVLGTRFTANDNGTTQTLADVWRVRPSATLALGWGG